MEKAYALSSEHVIEQLKSNEKAGLSQAEAERRLIQYGLNSLGEEKRTPLWKRFLSQFADAMVLILIGAAVLSAIMALNEPGFEGWIDVIVIMAIVIINAILGVYQEGKADQAIAALKRMSSPQSKVIRDGEKNEIPSDQLVPGDIIALEAGDLVAADIRILSQSSIKVEEASLTGESVPVEKNAQKVLAEDTGLGDRENMFFMGTAITYGRAVGVVTDTGTRTELGKIATKLKTIDDSVTPLQRNLTGLGKLLGAICIVVCIIVFLVDVFIQHTPWDESLMIAVSLAVAAIPEGLAAVVTIVLAIGMTRMASRNAIVRKLLAVETLGCVDVICSDKTGTLTQNEMTVTRLYAGERTYHISGTGYMPVGEISSDDDQPVQADSRLRFAMLACVLCNDAVLRENEEGRYTCIGDPTEGSLVALAGKAGYEREETNRRYPRITELPFDSERKMMTTYHLNVVREQITSFTKGAPDVILNRCTHCYDGENVIPLTDSIKRKIEEMNHRFATDALRVLALSYRTYGAEDENILADFSHENDLIFLGLAGMIDPARPEAKEAIRVCREAGIRPVMITGDYKDTAVAIAHDLGMMAKGVQSLSGSELDKISDEELEEKCEATSVYARVSPDHKVRIVGALQKNDHIVSMTGDGVNDAMALKTADIGVAMGITGTEVAKNSSDMILTDDNFATIVHAIEEGRIIYSNIRKFVGFLLSCNVGEILVIFIISLIPAAFFNTIGEPVIGAITPLTAIQLLWLNLVTDSFPALALGREKGEPDIMSQPPRPRSESIINKRMRTMILVQSTAIFAAVFSAFLIGMNILFVNDAARLPASRTMAFATLIIAELFRAFSSRSERVSVFKLGLLSNRMMNVAVSFSALMLLAVIYIPGVNGVFDNTSLPPVAWIPIIALAIIPFLVSELFKIIRSKRRNLRKETAGDNDPV
ncbi:MAG: cation-translocating P-type ATPase [Clostridiales bacterium]|nr:cation-translocating P-type ATPase [Clostridiales bacterium]